jgi:hypothetical protein
VGENQQRRLVAWAAEMRTVHQRLRGAVALARESAGATGQVMAESRDLLLYCWGFCQALSGHHDGEDAVLFPALEAAHPDLAPVLRNLRQDHSMIEHLVQGLAAAVDARRSPDELVRHLDGIEAVMESHFGYEERKLLALLDELRLDAEPRSAYGPLA